MNLGLEGKTALVTGGSAGIGKATAKALSLEGVAVAIAARDVKRLEAAAAEIHDIAGGRVLPVSVDMMKREQIEAMVDWVANEFGGLNILVNNAGASKFGDPLTIEPDAFADAMTLKYLGYVFCARAAAKYMIEKGWGRIVNVLGSGGKQILPMHIPGGAANAALELFTKGFGLHLADKGVLVNAVSPGGVATERLVKLIQSTAEANGRTYDEEATNFFKDSPLGRPAQPEEVANLILFLASELAGYFVGSHVFMDGGSVKST